MAKKYANMDRATAIKLALAILEPFKEAGNIYDDYKADEKFTNKQYDAMIAELKKDGPWSIVYEAEGNVYHCGPWDTEAEAMAWAKANNYKGPDGESEFDINDQRVYLLHPDHRVEELSASDLDTNEVEVEGGVFTFETDDGTIRYTDNHGNSEGVWRPGEPEYDQYKAQYFPTNEVEEEADEDLDSDDGFNQ